MELAQIEGGGEGVLPTLWLLAERYANRRGYTQLEWIVHAVNCARPNFKLKRVLERRGFEIRALPGESLVYYKLVDWTCVSSLPSRTPLKESYKKWPT